MSRSYFRLTVYLTTGFILSSNYFLNILMTQSEQNSKKRKSKVSLEKNLPEEFVEWLHIKTLVINNLQDSSFCVCFYFFRQTEWKISDLN